MPTSDAQMIRRAVAANGQAVIDERTQHEAVMLAAALGLALDQAALAPGCARCVRREKAAGAAEPQIRQAVTWQDGEPVCWDDFEVSTP